MSKLAAIAGVARAPFLVLPVTLVAAGAAAAAYDDRASALATVLALIGLVALHAAVNAFNEASDMRSGIDLQTKRTPFSGGSGTLPSGALPVGGAVGVGVAGSAVGLLVGIYFMTRIGWWPLAGVMALGAVAVLVYTQLFARTGVGEVFAGLGLGLLPVVGTALVQAGEIGPAAWAAGVPAFFMTFNLLLLNEFPDEQADRAGGRLNLVLMLGRRRAALVYIAAAVATPLSVAASDAAAPPYPPPPHAALGRGGGAGQGPAASRADRLPAILVRGAGGAVGGIAAAGAGADSGHGRQRDLEPRDELDDRGGPRAGGVPGVVRRPRVTSGPPRRRMRGRASVPSA
jgi:1,4-dihydroxy-2-naphthoate polyprenyltransferase